jgi:hypothetical protein
MGQMVTNNNGDEFELTKEEEKYLRAIKRLEKLKSGRLNLFGSGRLSVRLGGDSNYRTVYDADIYCAGGDGGDDFD